MIPEYHWFGYKIVFILIEIIRDNFLVYFIYLLIFISVNEMNYSVITSQMWIVAWNHNHNKNIIYKIFV